MKLVDLVPGVTVLLHGRKRTVERVIMHPTGPIVKLSQHLYARSFYPYAEMVAAGAEVAA